MIPASVSAIPGVARTRPRAGLRRPRLATAPCSAPGAKAVPPSAQGDECFPRTVPVKQRSNKQSFYFQYVAAKKRIADRCQSNNRQAIARAFSFRRRPNPSASRLTQAVGDRALPRVEADIRMSKAANVSRGQPQSSNGQANNRFISSTLQRKSAPRIAANQTTVKQ